METVGVLNTAGWKMQKVSENLWIGNDEDCKKAVTNKLPTIHISRGCYSRAGINKETKTDIYFDVIDMPIHENAYLFKEVTKLVAWCTGKKEILIHCNQGINRAPFFAMILLFHWGEYADAWAIWKEREKNVLRLKK